MATPGHDGIGKAHGSAKLGRPNQEKPCPERSTSALPSLKLELPNPASPMANYVPAVRSGNLLFLSGQICQWNGERRFIGKLGARGLDRARQGSGQLCGLNLWRRPARARWRSRPRVRVVRARRLRQRRSRFRRSAASGERRLRSDGRGLRRCRPARTHRGRRRSRCPAARRSRSMRCSRSARWPMAASG